MATKWTCDECQKPLPSLAGSFQVTRRYTQGMSSGDEKPCDFCSRECLARWAAKRAGMVAVYEEPALRETT